MGKIQAAIKILNNKVRPTAAVTETLHIPAQQEHESSPLPTDPAGIKTWLVAQGFANKGFPNKGFASTGTCLLYTSPSPRDATLSRMPSSA